MGRRNDRRPRPFRLEGNEDEQRLRKIQARVFENLEDCRLAWKENRDPLALMIALKKAEESAMPLPAWLTDALLVILVSGRPNLNLLDLRELWSDRDREARDMQRAGASLTARTDPVRPETWDGAHAAAVDDLAREERAVFGVTPTPASVKKSYHEVRHGLANEGAYWQAWIADGMGDRLKLAMLRRAGGM